MIYYPPQILFLLRARQLRSRSSIFFPFTAHRATLPSSHPALALVGSSLPSLVLFVPRHLSKWLTASFIIRLSAFLHFYPKLSRLSIVPAANSYGHNTVLKDFNMRIIVTVSSVLLSFDSVL